MSPKASVSLFPLALLLACAPGSAKRGGIGCSKTSSVLKTPQIRSMIDFLKTPTADQQRDRVMRFLVNGFNKTGQSIVPSISEPLKTTGGYIFINSRRANDPLGLLKDADGKIQGELKRCSVLLEFPKHTGEIPPPASSAQIKFPSESAAIAAFRFPGSSDPMRVRIYTAAHCLDYSLADSAQLAIYNVSGTTLPAPADAYLTFDVKIPELEAVKQLRKEVRKKIQSQTITEAEGIKILNALRPSTHKLDRIFGEGAPEAQQQCKLDTRSATTQISCATYHDMAVLDLELTESIGSDLLNSLREIRAQWVNNTTAAETKGPWSEYVKPAEPGTGLNHMRLFIDSIMSSSIDPTLKSDDGKTDPSGKCTGFPTYSLGAWAGASLTTKLGLFHPSPENCLEVPLNSPANLAYVRYITRERLRTFSRYNMLAMVKELGSGLSDSPLNLDQCGSVQNGVCSLKDAINRALDGMLPGLNLAQVNAQFGTDYSAATDYVNAVLSVWNPFFAVASANKVNGNKSGTNVFVNGKDLGSAANLNMMINPIDFLRLNSNYIIQETADALPSSTDVALHRGFMAMPMPSIVGMESFEFSAETATIPSSETATIPVEIMPWTSSTVGSGFGKFLKLKVNISKLNYFFDSAVDKDETNVGSPPGMFNSGESLPPNDTIFVNDGSASTFTLFPLPTKVLLQKGDSGSIFTLDSIPAFALSTVNGEATSGGAAVRAVPIADVDVGDAPPGAPNSPNAPGNTSVAVSCK